NNCDKENALGRVARMDDDIENEFFSENLPSVGHKTGLVIYPNKSNGTFTVSKSFNETAEYVIRIYALDGRQIYSDSGSGDSIHTQIKLDDSAIGTYFLELETANSIETGRVLIVR
ncbi:MAG: T9SS type A sorting domain-containing protein, partial [Bacteroidota bacterium]